MNGFVDHIFNVQPRRHSVYKQIEHPFFFLWDPQIECPDASSRWGEGEVELIDKILINWVRLISEHHF